MGGFHLRYGALVQLVERIHALPDSRGGATESRIKNFSRLGFPPGERVGSGERTEYGAAQVVQLLVGFELLRHRMPPAVIAEIVRTEWDRVAAAFATAARAMTAQAHEPAETGGALRVPILLVDALALHEVGKTIRQGELLTTIEVVERDELHALLIGGATSPRSALLVDPAAILRDVAVQLPWLRRTKDAAEFIAAVEGMA